MLSFAADVQAPRGEPGPTLDARWRGLRERLETQDVPRLAALFAAVLVASGAAVFLVELGTNPAFQSLGDGLWWSIVTMTSTGYGDKTPVTGTGRLLASAVMILGVGLTAIVTARIAAVMVEKRIKEGRGLSDASRLSGHVVILGFKSDLPEFLSEIFAVSPDLKEERIVVLNQASEEEVEELRALFPGLLYIRGDMVDPLALGRVNLARASKAIILAEDRGDRSDHEIDARTVMAAMTVKSLAPHVYTCAEVLDKKYAEHLQLARCDEVVLSREYSRSLLVGATVASGITHVLHDLLDLSDDKALLTEPVEPPYVGRTFAAYAAHFKARGALLVGILENTGQALEIKRDALREAQKTAHVQTLVENLRHVKELTPNRPVLAPPDDYVIPPHSRAVFIGRAGTAS